MKFYIIRHGQTNWNQKGRIQGKTDIELDEEYIEATISISYRKVMVF